MRLGIPEFGVYMFKVIMFSWFSIPLIRVACFFSFSPDYFSSKSILKFIRISTQVFYLSDLLGIFSIILFFHLKALFVFKGKISFL